MFSQGRLCCSPSRPSPAPPRGRQLRTRDGPRTARGCGSRRRFAGLRAASQSRELRPPPDSHHGRRGPPPRRDGGGDAGAAAGPGVGAGPAADRAAAARSLGPALAPGRPPSPDPREGPSPSPRRSPDLARGPGPDLGPGLLAPRPRGNPNPGRDRRVPLSLPKRKERCPRKKKTHPRAVDMEYLGEEDHRLSPSKKSPWNKQLAIEKAQLCSS
nr:formin-like protein 18 [Saimiri boliviensis boliviensis]